MENQNRLQSQLIMKNQFFPLLLSLFIITNCSNPNQSQPEQSAPEQSEPDQSELKQFYGLDVLNYDLTIEPNIQGKSVQGTEVITFLAADSAVFDCGDLIIDEVEGEGIIDFEKEKNALKLILAESKSPEREVTISYHGNPRQGIQFFPKVNQVHTVFFAEQWMVCRKQNDDRASIQMKIIAPNSLMAIGNGDFIAKKEIDEARTEFSWHQETEMPSYIFGFAIGDYQVADESMNDVSLQYLAHNYSPKDLKTIFKETKGMMDFFEEKSGVPYYQKNYTQILGPQTVSQEMAGFTVIRNLYGKQVLGDSTQINLSAHELAHQWWGNLLTCKSWRDFWLNEGMAVFMSSAYKEHRFGKKVYLEDIEVYFQAYKKVKDKNLDKPLKFDNWNNPSAADRTLVYYKGAYFIHLLREKLGEEAFWKGINIYTQENQAKSVVSKDFQTAMEKASEQDLDSLFQEWVF